MKDEKQAAIELGQWITDASGSGLEPMMELSEKIGRHKENILNSVRCQANSAKSEAVNTTIKVLIKMARGFRNIGNMIALIYLKCSDLVIPRPEKLRMNFVNAGSQVQYPHDPDDPGHPRSVLRFGARGHRTSRRRFTLAGFSDGCYNARFRRLRKV